MQATRSLLQKRQPLIKFLGKRSVPKQIDHAPHPHPANPTHNLPESFASYREQATQHGPLKGSQPRQQQQQQQQQAAPSAPSGSAAAQTAEPYGAIGGRSARELGSVKPGNGEFWDRDELPRRFHRLPFSQAEIEAVETGGASLLV